MHAKRKDKELTNDPKEIIKRDALKLLFEEFLNEKQVFHFAKYLHSSCLNSPKSRSPAIPSDLTLAYNASASSRFALIPSLLKA